MMSGGLDAHKHALSKLCRFCGCRLLSSGYSYIISNHQHLWENSEFNFDNDDIVIHPQAFCHKCYCKLLNANRRQQIKEWRPKNDWLQHRRILGPEACTTCTMVLPSKGGRPPKRKSPGRPPLPSISVSSHFLSLSNNCLVYSMSKFMSKNHFMLCKLCGNVLVNPCVSSCEHVFCLSCVHKSFVSASRVSVPCAICQTPLHYTSVKLIPQFHLTTIHSTHITCQVCNIKLPYLNAKVHTCVHDTHDHPYTEQTTGITLTNLSPTQKEMLGTAIIKEKLKESNDGTATFHTKGKVNI